MASLSHVNKMSQLYGDAMIRTPRPDVAGVISISNEYTDEGSMSIRGVKFKGNKRDTCGNDS